MLRNDVFVTNWLSVIYIFEFCHVVPKRDNLDVFKVKNQANFLGELNVGH